MYQNKTMLITGAYRGIGKAIAKYFASCGINIIMTYHQRINETVALEEELKKEFSVNVESVYLDLSSEKSVQYLYETIKEKYGKIDILVNNAAISLDNHIIDKTKDEFMDVLEINTVGTFLMMKYFNNIIDGYIFNISSTDGVDTGNIYSIDYNASKAAINSITKTFALYSHNKIISLCPNWVNTESTKGMDESYLKDELKRIGQKELISVDTIPKVMNDCMQKNISSGSIIRIEGDNCVLGID